MKRPASCLAWSALVLVACSDAGRTVQAHYESGALKSESHELPGSEGAWIKDGPFCMWHEGGELANEGEHRDDQPIGSWAYWYPDGTLEARGSYLFGEKEGIWVYRDPDGSIDETLTGVYEAGTKVEEYLIDGVQADYFVENRPRERVSYVDGLRQGTCTTWYPDGSKRSEGEFDKGRKAGHWTHWREDGSVDPERSGVYDGWQKLSD